MPSTDPIQSDYAIVALVLLMTLAGALLALIVVGILSLFTHFVHPTVYSWLTLGVFSILVLVDFARIKAGGTGAGAVELATAIYLDSLNILLAVLQIMGRSREE